MRVYILALLAALLVAGGSVIQARSASGAPPEKLLSIGLLGWLVQRPLWLAGVVASVLGNLAFALAVGTGDVAVAEALLTARLLFALPMAAAWGRHRVPPRDWGGAIAITAGLVGFLLIEAPGAGTPGVPAPRWAAGAAAVALFVLVAMVVARPLGPTRKAPLLAAGAGALFGTQASLTSSAIAVLSGSGAIGLLVTWHGYAVVAAAVSGMLLIQSAYGMAPLAASYPALVATELLAGIGIAVGVLGAPIRLDPLPLGTGMVCLAAMVYGIVIVTTSPLVTGELDRLQRRQDAGTALRTAAREERDLARARRRVNRVEAGAAGGRYPSRTRKRLDRSMRRVDREIKRLDELRRDIVAHRDAERARGGAATCDDEDVLGGERRIAERADWLRAQAQALENRIRDVDRLA